ncbi:Gfo/Idh/MocA family oxidoreductase, partial [bacterium]|nr:Gfo/Idh/MocA family oxidoreductase [bacterium]
VLDMMDKGRIDVASLISHRFPFNQAKDAYKLLTSDEPSLGIVLEYPDAPESDWRNDRSVRISATTKEIQSPSKARIGILGAGNFAARTLLPVLHQQGADIKMIASQGGVSGVQAARKFGIPEAVSDSERIFTDPKINAVFILTQHHSHAGYVIDSLKCGKHVFVEKPLALTLQEVDEIERAYSAIEQPPLLLVGFNRRFAPHIQAMKPLLDSAASPKSFILTVNAGAIPSQHWTQDPKRGGGRIIGEACHFVDLLRFLSGSKIQTANIHTLGNSQTRDTASIQLKFCDGSIGTIHYFANGNKTFPKERLEVFCEERILQLDNFLTLRGYGWPGAKKMKRWKQDKGHSDEIKAFLHAVENGGPIPIP